MPILECGVQTASEVIESKMLIDSGSALNLVSGVMARKLQKKGCIVKAAKKQVRIKVANGKRSVLNTTMSLQLQLGPEISEGTDFHVLEDLPFDLILGHEACVRWNGNLDWGKATFSIQPGVTAKRVPIQWNVYRGQHWRSPALFTAKEDATSKPGEQVVLAVAHSERDFEGLVSRAGLVTSVYRIYMVRT